MSEMGNEFPTENSSSEQREEISVDSIQERAGLFGKEFVAKAEETLSHGTPQEQHDFMQDFQLTSGIVGYHKVGDRDVPFVDYKKYQSLPRETQKRIAMLVGWPTAFELSEITGKIEPRDNR